MTGMNKHTYDTSLHDSLQVCGVRKKVLTQGTSSPIPSSYLGPSTIASPQEVPYNLSCGKWPTIRRLAALALFAYRYDDHAPHSPIAR